MDPASLALGLPCQRLLARFIVLLLLDEVFDDLLDAPFDVPCDVLLGDVLLDDVFSVVRISPSSSSSFGFFTASRCSRGTIAILK